MFRVLCQYIDFIDFHSANLGVCAPGGAAVSTQSPRRVGGGQSSVVTARPPSPSIQLNSFQAQWRLRKTRGHKRPGDTNDPGPQAAGLQSRPFYLPSSSTIPGLLVLSPHHCRINTVSSSLQVNLSREAPTPAPLLAHTLPVSFSAAPSAPRITEKGWGGRESGRVREQPVLPSQDPPSRPEAGVQV